MSTTTIETSILLKKYDESSEQIKQAFISLFGSHVFNPISEEIRKRFEKTCKDQGLDPSTELHTGTALTKNQIVANAYTMLRVLAKAKRGNWEPDYTDSNQKKWYPWFEFKPGKGFVFGVTNCSCTYTLTDVGSRLCFANSEDAKSFTLENIELFKIILEN